MINLVKGKNEKKEKSVSYKSKDKSEEKRAYREKTEDSKRIGEHKIIDEIKRKGFTLESLPEVLDEYVRLKRKEFGCMNDDAWKEFLIAGIYEKENEALKDIFYNARGVFYCLSVFFGYYFGGEICAGEESMTICRVTAQVIGRMEMYGKFEEGKYVLSVKPDVGFDRESYFKYLGIELNEIASWEEMKKKTARVKAVIQESKEKQERIKEKSICREMWRKCGDVFLEFAEIFDAEKNHKQDFPEISEIAKKLIKCFEECGVEFKSYSEEINDYFISEDAAPRAAVYNSVSDDVIIKGNHL